MEDKQLLSILIETREDIGAIKTGMQAMQKSLDGMCSRVEELEQKPVKRVDGAITTVIATVVAALVSSIIAFFTKN